MSGKAALLIVSASIATTVALTGCGGSTSADSTSTTSGAAAASTTTAAPATAAPADPAAKVSANTASEDDIAAALKAAGVSNPARWAEEVVEYRPYPADDPNLGKLRDNLAKYNPGQETVDKIVSALTP
ncbi:hypothetical protein A5784_19135 [Mycobacterium sp. 852013-50091_SCH5140682]|uniref:hypothetical protein n=1 Tax=Mycobacterium sp. 852013-50091_SCH5140682 TaxID=1834109 RepID=UPI0007EAC75F|nr:hypothetical protein [Mycobacterium sp. 852013-50091_SCH5140682]OBC00851.1 hypothetical protein A5784_19135 [Mycobacterium sp. 852013-50091_SCH5140682]